MTYQCMLVHVDDSEVVALRLGVAARLARSFDAELIGAYVVPGATMTPSMSAVLPDSVVERRLQQGAEAQAAAEELFRAAASRARLTNAEWRAPAGAPMDALTTHARCCDLAIIGQRDPDDPDGGFVDDVANALVLRSGRPVLSIPFREAPPTVGSGVLIAWNGSREAARAVADAMPLLARAETVHLVTVTDDEEANAPGGAADQRIANWLRHHGIEPVRRHDRAPSGDVGEMILSEALAARVDLIVMGGYTHSPLQQAVLGGVTRTVLDAMTVPVLLSH